MDTNKKNNFSEMVGNILLNEAIENSPAGIERRKKVNLWLEEFEKKRLEFGDDFSELDKYLLSEKGKFYEKKIFASRKKNFEDAAFFQEVIKTIDGLRKEYQEHPNNIAGQNIKKDGGEEAIETSYPVTPTLTEVKSSPDEIFLPLPENFSQITYTASISKDELLSDFMILNTEKNPINDKPFMEEQDVVELLNKTFTIFGCIPTSGKYFSINLLEGQRYILPNFIHKIYTKYELQSRGNKKKYALFIKSNFELYKDDKLDSLYDIMRLQKNVLFQIYLPQKKK